MTIKRSKEFKEALRKATTKNWKNKEIRKKMSDGIRNSFNWRNVRGENSSRWKGGVKKTKEGYLLQWAPEHPYKIDGKYVLQHRLVVEKKIGRYLKRNEHVHHLCRDKSDNRPEILIAFKSNSAHRRFHENPYSVKKSEIVWDGRTMSDEGICARCHCPCHKK